ncbi:STM4015 family protein [Streptomyces sp. NPDC050504]|uniref:STM4015 family protein n=1 Tax=Streptomyces sp. NPDC050504 TaxID=3365618 RepID=UPI0037910EC9
MIHVDHQKELYGLPVFVFPEKPGAAPLPAPDAVAWRLECSWDDERSFPELWRDFLDAVDASRVRALVVGMWWSDEPLPLSLVLEPLLAAADRLTGLRALFLADVTSDECEISWIEMSDVTPVLDALPGLEELSVRGGSQYVQVEEGEDEPPWLRPVRHAALRVLRLESGGLPGEVVRAVAACELPALEHLELWLGSADYGDAALPDVQLLLASGRFPRLRHLGLQDSEFQDAIAEAVAGAPVVAGLESLALSKGTLGDRGAEALLNGQPLTHLRALDLHHHYIGPEVQARLRGALEPYGVRLDLDRANAYSGRSGRRYVAVSE